MAQSSSYRIVKEGFSPKIYKTWTSFWYDLIPRFGLGNTLFSAVTDLNPQEMQSYINAGTDNVYDPPLPTDSALFYLDNICTSPGVQCLIVVKDNNGTRHLNKCAPLTPDGLYDYLLKALVAFSGKSSYIYVFDQTDGTNGVVNNRNMALTQVASVQDMLRCSSCPASMNDLKPDWAPVLGNDENRRKVQFVNASSSSADTKTQSRCVWIGVGILLVFLLAAGVIGGVVYNNRRKNRG